MQLHATIAAFTIPEMALEESEAQVLARALTEFEKYYPINPLREEKHKAALALGVAVVRVYGKRVPAIMGKSSKPAEPLAPATPAAAPYLTPVETPPTDWFAQTGAASDHMM